MNIGRPAIASCFVALLLLSLRTEPTRCDVFTRKDVPARDSLLYDSLQKAQGTHLVFRSDSFTITDTAKISYPYITGNTFVYHPVYMQFTGKYRDFLTYILYMEASLDSVKTCGDKASLYYRSTCDGCDSGFFASEQYLPFQFYFYRYHEIYSSFYSFNGINQVEIFVNGRNQTYLPTAGDLPVYAPGKCMQKKWYRKDLDYAKFFPVNFPAIVGGDFILTDDNEFIWRESAADRYTAGVKRK